MGNVRNWGWDGNLWVADLACGHAARLTAKEMKAGVYYAVPGETVPCPECNQEGDGDG